MDKKSTSSGVGIFGLLGVAFVVLKLCHVIEWEWWAVLAPFWVPFAFLIGAVILYVLADFMVEHEKKRDDK